MKDHKTPKNTFCHVGTSQFSESCILIILLTLKSTSRTKQISKKRIQFLERQGFLRENLIDPPSDDSNSCSDSDFDLPKGKNKGKKRRKKERNAEHRSSQRKVKINDNNNQVPPSEFLFSLLLLSFPCFPLSSPGFCLKFRPK